MSAADYEPQYIPERGYWLGDDLEPGEEPWPLLWEQRTYNDDHNHTWERVVVHRNGVEPEPVVRCLNCHVPRCGHSDDRDPCMERRHHDLVHIRLHGGFDPVSGYLPTEEQR